LSSFINEYKELVFEGNYTDFNTFHEAYDNIANTLEIDSMDKETISSAMKFLEGIKFTFLNQDEINDFAEIWDPIIRIKFCFKYNMTADSMSNKV
jgi:hypothetical protein